jgi:hypothetical protein
LGESAKLLVEKLHGELQEVTVQLSMPRLQKHPVTAPQAVTTEGLSGEIGLLRVAMFLGAIGIDVAKDIDHGLAYLNGAAASLWICAATPAGDLQTSPHELSGARKTQGWLRLTRKRRNVVTTAKNSLDSGEFRPTKRRFFGSQLGTPFVEKSILVLTEGRGKQPYHGRGCW